MQTNEIGKILDGRVAFVTGGARGLGRKIAYALADAGALGAVFDEMPASEENSAPPEWMYRQGDATREIDVSSAMEATFKNFGRLDVVVANAGIVSNWRRTADIALDEWRRVFAVNVEGVAICLKYAAKIMEPTGGSIVAMGSLNSWKGHEQQAAYVASKHAVLGLVRSAAIDLGRDCIRVNALAPGPVATEALTKRVARRAAQGDLPLAGLLEEMANATALGRMVTDQDVAMACLFLASDLSRSITGQMLPVDSGLL